MKRTKNDVAHARKSQMNETKGIPNKVESRTDVYFELNVPDSKCFRKKKKKQNYFFLPQSSI